MKYLKITKNKQLLAIVLSVLLVGGCADTVTLQQAIEINPVGFWYGLWHGATMPFAFIGSLIDNDIAIYAIYNNGGWYDFGFFCGIGGFNASMFSSK